MSGLAAVVASVPVLVAAAVVPGGAWVLAAGRTDRSRAETVGTALALSPGLLGGAIALLRAAGLSLHDATSTAFAGFAALAAIAAFVHRGPRLGASSAPSSPRDTRLTWVVALGVTALVGLLPLFCEWWRIYSDAWNHVAIIRAVARDGVLPFDPFFAGMHLQYPTIYHSQMAALGAATGASPFALMALWSGFALAGVLLCAGPAASRVPGGSQGWGLAMLVLGLNAAFPLFTPLLAAKAFIGDVRGWSELVRTFTFVPFGITSVTGFLQTLQGQNYFLNKFMVATPFALGVAAYAAFTAALLRWLQRRDPRELWIVAGAMLAAGLMHPVVTLDLLGATLAFAAIALAAPRLAGVGRGAAAALAGAALAGALPVVWYTSRIIGGEGGTHRELPIDVSAWKLIGLYSCTAAGLAFALPMLVRDAREGGARRAWAAWIALQFAIATVIRIPGPSSFYTIDKFAYFVWVPLALTAGAGFTAFLSRLGPVRRAALVVLLFVPVTGLAMAARIADPGTPARQPWNLPGLAWMRAHLPADAVLLVPYGDPLTGNYVGRDVYTSDEALGLQLGYPVREIAARRALAEHFFAEDSLRAEDAARLAALGRPVVAVWTDFRDPRFAVTPRLFWSGYFGVTPSERRPAWTGRYPVLFDSGPHVVAALVPARPAASAPDPHPTPASGSTPAAR